MISTDLLIFVEFIESHMASHMNLTWHPINIKHQIFIYLHRIFDLVIDAGARQGGAGVNGAKEKSKRRL